MDETFKWISCTLFRYDNIRDQFGNINKLFTSVYALHLEQMVNLDSIKVGVFNIFYRRTLCKNALAWGIPHIIS